MPSARKISDILVVDDDQNMRLTMAEILRDDGYTVHIAASGEEAVELCRTQTFRLILMDVRMPGINGLEAFRGIRQNCKRSQIVLMSAYTDPDLIESALREGVHAFLKKPVDMEAVGRLIAAVTSTSVLYVGELDATSQGLYDALLTGGYRPSLAPSIDDSLMLCQQICYDAVILDLEAVRGDGDAGFARFHAEMPEIPMILIHSGDAESVNEARSAILSGAMAELKRPFPPDAVLSLLEIVKKRRLADRPPEP